jgi:putative membrane protein
VAVALTQMPLSGIAVLAPLLAVGDDLRDLVPFETPSFGEPSAGGWLFWAIPLVLIVVVVFSAILNLIRVLLVDWNLTITATAAGLRRDSGLFSTSSVASSVPRIQRLEVSQSALERVAGLHTVVLHTIGSGDFNVPGCDPAQVEMIRAIASEEILEPTARDRRVSPAAVFKTVRNTSVAMTLVAAGIAVQFGWWGLLAFLAVPVAWFDTRRRTRLRRWGISDSAISDRQQFIKWTQEDVLFRKANGARVSQTLFERKRDLATVTVHTADGSISIGMVGLDEARAVRDRALFVAETDHHVWM